MKKTDTIYIAGHTGLVGSSILETLHQDGYTNVIYKTIEQLDLTRQQQVEKFFARYRPQYIFLAAAKVGGILANSTYPAEFIYQNLMIQANIIHAAYTNHAKKLIFLGSSCIYPRQCPQPIREEYLLTGVPETTNQAYAIAKISGIELCRAYNHQYRTKFISCMPTNLYGPRDNFDPISSHVIPGLIAAMYTAKIQNLPTVTVWGTGTPRREFLYVDDLADATIFLMQNYTGTTPLNIGVGSDISIAQLAYLIKEMIGFNGTIAFDPTKPDGTPQKLLNIEKIALLGWHARTSLTHGLQKTIDSYIQQQNASNGFSCDIKNQKLIPNSR